MFTITIFETLLSGSRSVLSPAQRGTGSERVKYTLNTLYIYYIYISYIYILYAYIYVHIYIYISKCPHQRNFLLSNYDTRD